MIEAGNRGSNLDTQTCELEHIFEMDRTKGQLTGGKEQWLPSFIVTSAAL